MNDEQTSQFERMIRESVRSEVSVLFDDLRRFVDRRMAEVSAEVNATVQLVDYSEANLSGQLTRIHDQIARVVAVPAEATRNSGIELESVVEATETAATKIMEAAEAISVWASSAERDGIARAAIAEKVSDIFEACSFQDITGQRIRRAIEHLQRVETMLSDMVAGETDVQMAPPPPLQQLDGPDLAQDEIDRLMA